MVLPEVLDSIVKQRTDVSRRSRGAIRPSYWSLSLLGSWGRRESRVPIAPVGPVQKKARG